MAKEEFNQEPIYYCKQCLSLKIMRVAGMDDVAYCDECGSTDIEETSIEEWRKLYRERYGFDYLENTY